MALSRPPMESLGSWQGAWWEATAEDTTEPSYFSLGFDFSKWRWLAAEGERCEGQISWKQDDTGSNPEWQHLADKVGQVAIEYVRGTYDWRTGKLDVVGYDTDEIGRELIEPSTYQIQLDVEAEMLSGKSRDPYGNCGNVDGTKVAKLMHLTAPSDTPAGMLKRVYARIEGIKLQRRQLEMYSSIPGLSEALAKSGPLAAALAQRRDVCPNLFMAIHAAEPAEVEGFLLAQMHELLNVTDYSLEKTKASAANLNFFKENLLPLNVWWKRSVAKAPEAPFLFALLLKEAHQQYDRVVKSLKFVVDPRLRTIHNAVRISRQDDERVGLVPDGAGTNSRLYDLEVFNSHLRFVGAELNTDFGNFMAGVLASKFKMFLREDVSSLEPGFCAFRHGPVKAAERCVSKVINDYAEEDWPQSAKLLDIVRCSYIFANVDDLLLGYNALMAEFASTHGKLVMARCKNMFVGDEPGYRDIKLNVVFRSTIGGEVQRMIGEVQLILSAMLLFKKRAHGLYAITRDEAFFTGVVESATDAGLEL